MVSVSNLQIYSLFDKVLFLNNNTATDLHYRDNTQTSEKW